jgi:uncharacterized protein (TIGR02611 family)
MGTLREIQEAYAEFRATPPGRRFRERHLRRKEWRKGSRLRRTLKVVAGLLLFVVGLIMMPAPGPGIVVVFPGAALLADEFLFMARLLDKAEVLLRKAVGWVWDRFRRLSRPLQVLAVLLAFSLGAAMAYGAWRFWSGRS